VGRPDIVFRAARVVVFCDGDYWHGRDLDHRLAKLAAGHNAPHWVAKITSNVERDRRVTAALESEGWLVLRYWETDIKKSAPAIAREVATHIQTRCRLYRQLALAVARSAVLAPQRPLASQLGQQGGDANGPPGLGQRVKLGAVERRCVRANQRDALRCELPDAATWRRRELCALQTVVGPIRSMPEQHLGATPGHALIAIIPRELQAIGDEVLCASR
jgi:hypothetical protein